MFVSSRRSDGKSNGCQCTYLELREEEEAPDNRKGGHRPEYPADIGAHMREQIWSDEGDEECCEDVTCRSQRLGFVLDHF